MAWKSWIFFVKLATILFRISVEDRAILLERPTPGVTGPQSWYWETSHSEGHGSGWSTFPSDSGTFRYTVCDIGVQQPSNWIWSYGIDHNKLKRIDIAINYSMKRCALYDDANVRKFCSERFDVYGYQSNQEPNNSYSDPRNGHYSKMETISLPSNSSNQSVSVQNIAEMSLFIKERTSKVFLAIHDQGACLVVNSIVVTYNVCPRKTLPDSLVLLPQTIAPVNESKIVKVMGKCAANSEPTAPELGANCGSSGEWVRGDVSTGECLCIAGWEKVASECQVCALGYFKDKLGNVKCSKCPEHSVAGTGRKSCKCKRGFFRATWERFSDNCTGIPSAPRHLRKLDFNQTTVSLSWSQPRHLGGRNDLFYEIECKIVCREDELSCSQDCGTQVLFLPRQGNFSQTKATVTNLFPRTGYIFKIYAKNGVSAVAEKDGYSSKFATSEVTTLESAPEKPEVTIRRTDSTSVIVSWTLNNGNEGIHYYLVTYRKLSDGSDEHTINTTQTKIEITGLEPGVEYEFEVSVQSVV
ncbi:ephrin type-A receptor 4-like [Orbicella faveolata]|uniref:ephrin type-A receptor 4-like n=1 Tax=Orbicella faveolata TaxID=48498 RepID=UPI0009E60AB8|nr:ephrin type-A receptor 4-like [Orbicella faveolata]XP_020600983.1 ephrin type-A receptor 4-like [Orbicella faveolata]